MMVVLGIFAKALVIWLGILVMAVINGAFREAVLMPALGRAGLILSGVLLCILIIAVACVALPWFGPLPPARYVEIGVGWLLLTLVFEFTFGRLVQGRSWSELLEAYRFKDGNIWPVVLLVTAIAPYMTAKMLGLA